MFVGEQKDVTREWILGEHALHARMQPIKTLPQIHRLQSKEDAGGGRQA
jgi:hypothetical protein